MRTIIIITLLLVMGSTVTASNGIVRDEIIFKTPVEPVAKKKRKRNYIERMWFRKWYC